MVALENGRRIVLTIEFDGTAYSGWQRQENAPSVQQVLEETIEQLVGEKCTVTGSGRTDAGVHALGLVAHFDTQSRIPPDKFSYALNTMLPPDIRVRESMEAPEGFHARFGAKRKQYRSQLHCAPHASALYRNQRAQVIYPLDVPLMQREAAVLVGTHDFAAFAASGSIVKSTTRTIFRAEVMQSTDDPALVQIIVEGDGFLYNMVRIIAGTLIGVGSGKINPGAIRRAIETGDRLALGITAPAHGLILMWVSYDET